MGPWHRQDAPLSVYEYTLGGASPVPAPGLIHGLADSGSHITDAWPRRGRDAWRDFDSRVGVTRERFRRQRVTAEPGGCAETTARSHT